MSEKYEKFKNHSDQKKCFKQFLLCNRSRKYDYELNARESGTKEGFNKIGGLNIS